MAPRQCTRGLSRRDPFNHHRGGRERLLAIYQYGSCNQADVRLYRVDGSGGLRPVAFQAGRRTMMARATFTGYSVAMQDDKLTTDNSQ